MVVTSPPDDDHPHASIESGYKRVQKRAAAASLIDADNAADERELDDALHRVRKAAKRLRYVAAANGNPKVSERAKTIQSLLGDHQDSVVSRGHLSERARTAHAAGEDTFTYGLLYQQETDLAQRSRDQLEDALHALKRSARAARGK